MACAPVDPLVPFRTLHTSSLAAQWARSLYRPSQFMSSQMTKTIPLLAVRAALLRARLESALDTLKSIDDAALSVDLIPVARVLHETSNVSDLHRPRPDRQRTRFRIRTAPIEALLRAIDAARTERAARSWRNFSSLGIWTMKDKQYSRGPDPEQAIARAASSTRASSIDIYDEVELAALISRAKGKVAAE